MTVADVDICLVRGHEEQLTSLKSELARVTQAMFAMPSASDDLVTRESALTRRLSMLV
jgi:hypothetical protein